MDTIQGFSWFTIEHPLVPSCDDFEALDKAAPRTIASRIAEIHLLAMDSNPLLHAQLPTPESLMGVREFLIGSYEEAVHESYRSGAGGGGILVARKTTQAQVQPQPGSVLGKEEEEVAEDAGDDERKEGEIISFATWEYTPSSNLSPDLSPDCPVETEPTLASVLVSSSSSPTSFVTTHDPSSSSDSESGNVENPEKTKTTSNNKLEASISQHVTGCQSHYLDEYARLATQAKVKYFETDKEYYQLSFVCVDPAYQEKRRLGLDTQGS